MRPRQWQWFPLRPALRWPQTPNQFQRRFREHFCLRTKQIGLYEKSNWQQMKLKFITTCHIIWTVLALQVFAQHKATVPNRWSQALYSGNGYIDRTIWHLCELRKLTHHSIFFVSLSYCILVLCEWQRHQSRPFRTLYNPNPQACTSNTSAFQSRIEFICPVSHICHTIGRLEYSRGTRETMTSTEHLSWLQTPVRKWNQRSARNVGIGIRRVKRILSFWGGHTQQSCQDERDHHLKIKMYPGWDKSPSR